MFRPLTVQQPTELLAFLFASLPEVKKNKVRHSLKFEAILVNGRTITQFDHPLQPFRHRVFDIAIFGSIPAGIPQDRTPGPNQHCCDKPICLDFRPCPRLQNTWKSG